MFRKQVLRGDLSPYHTDVSGEDVSLINATPVLSTRPGTWRSVQQMPDERMGKRVLMEWKPILSGAHLFWDVLVSHYLTLPSVLGRSHLSHMTTPGMSVAQGWVGVEGELLVPSLSSAFLLQSLYACVRAKLFQLCPTLCNAMDCSLPGSSVLGILQTIMLEWVVRPSSRGSSQPRDRTCVSYISCTGWLVLYH